MSGKERLCQLIEEKSAAYFAAADEIWGFAETRFSLPKSADALCKLLKDAQFDIHRGGWGMEDAFVATFGSGSPVIGVLGEYDALPALNQVADLPEKKATVQGAAGHGCGHNLLGVGAVAAAVALKEYMQEAGIKGTVKYFGCPAEESGSGKAFMARDGAFDGLDGVLTWHPMTENAMWGFSSLANYQVFFSFKGISSHAAAAPEMGRSALDAAELMNIGVNYLREHIIQEARVHYAYHDVGGEFPNVVQPTAKLLYFIRAPKSKQVHEIFERVVAIAEGAAKMTGTQMEYYFDSMCSEYIVNDVLGKAMYANMQSLGELKMEKADFDYAQKFVDTLSDRDRAATKMKVQRAFANKSPDEIEQISKKSILTDLMPYMMTDAAMPGSTDVGDASWCAPTVQLTTACYPAGTAGHSWQMVACGKSDMAHKGMLYASKAMAMTGLDMLTNPTLLEQAKEEFNRRLGGESYKNPIPKDVVPQE